MIYKIEFTKTALQEETEAYSYYEKKSEGLGEIFLNEVEENINNISLNQTHNSYSDSSKIFRDVSLSKFPFTIIRGSRMKLLSFLVFTIQENPNDFTKKK